MKKVLFYFVLLILCQGCIPVLVGTAVTTVTLLVIEDRSVGNTIDDTAILIKINKELLSSDLFSAIRIQVSEGRVLMIGSVDSPAQQVEAEKIAWQQRGVKEVINEITLNSGSAAKSKVSQSAKDTLITAQLKAKIITKGGVKSVNYSVNTLDGIVYLIGIAQDKDELQKVTSIARKVDGVKEVISYVRFKDSKLRG